MFPSTIMGTHTATLLVCGTVVTSSPPAAWRVVCGCCFYEVLGHWLGVGGSFRSTLGSLRPLSSLCPLGKYQDFSFSLLLGQLVKFFFGKIFSTFFNFFQTFSNLTFTCIYMFFLLSHGLRGLSPKGALSQLAMGCVTCHACHGHVTDFRPILGNPMEVTHVSYSCDFPGSCIYFPMLRELTSLS